jgi:hypothetical protein
MPGRPTSTFEEVTMQLLRTSNPAVVTGRAVSGNFTARS